MDHSTTEIRTQEWIRIIQDWGRSGLTKRDYCSREGINEKQFYYYQRRIRRLIAEQQLLPTVENGLTQVKPPQIVKLNLHGFVQNSAASVSFTVNGKTISVPENIPTTFLSKLLEAASHGSC